MDRLIISFLLVVLGLLAVTAPALAGDCTVRIMPLGDSITRGKGSADESGYRKNLFNALTDVGHSVDFVGSLKNGPSTFDRNHEGHGGWKAKGGTGGGVVAHIYDWLSKNPADVVLLHIATNDISGSDEHPAEVDQILNEIDRYDDKIDVILARIINRASYSAKTTVYNDQVVGMAQDRIANGDKITPVDQESVLDYAVDMADTVHPNDAGYAKMAEAWRVPLSDLLSSLCSGPVNITSKPIIWASIGSLYNYKVHALGNPPLDYQLLNAPAAMGIDPATGQISWQPDTLGYFDVTVAANNVEGTDTQTFTVSVLDHVIDNRSSGVSLTGAWSVSYSSKAYGGSSHISKTVGATYNFEGSVTGPQQVWLWWVQSSTRSPSVPVEVYDGNVLLDTVYVDQTQSGGQWNLLGSYPFSSGTAKVVITSLSSSVSTCADAVKFSSTGI